MMKMRSNLTVLLSCALGLFVVAGCGSDGGSPNGNNGIDGNTGGDAANVTFPDVSADSGDDSELINISDDGGISGSFFGGTDGDESTATISRIEGTTDEDSFVASFDSNLRTDRVTIGDTEIDVDYGTDGTFTYSVSRGEETVFSGSGLVAIRTDAELKRLQGSGFRLQATGASPEARSPEPSSRAAQRVDPEEVTQCRNELIASIANLVEVIEDPGSGTTASENFIACLREVDAVRRMASSLCTVELVFVPALEQVFLECASRSDPLMCLNRVAPAISSVLSFYGIINTVLIDIVIQIRRDAELYPSS